MYMKTIKDASRYTVKAVHGIQIVGERREERKVPDSQKWNRVEQTSPFNAWTGVGLQNTARRRCTGTGTEHRGIIVSDMPAGRDGASCHQETGQRGQA